MGRVETVELPEDHLVRMYSDENFANIAHERDAWRLTAEGAIAVALVSVVGCIYLGSQTKRVPMIWKETVAGKIEYEGMAHQGQMTADMRDAAVKETLSRVVEEWRAVTIDQELQKRFAKDVGLHIGSGSQAEHWIDEWYRKNPPLDRAGKEQVGIQIQARQPIGNETYRIQWAETVKKINSTDMNTTVWSAILTYIINDKPSDDPNDSNPMGVLITQISLSQVKQ